MPDECQCIADPFTNGVVVRGDLGMHLSHWGPDSKGSVADVNSDLDVDGADLGIRLSSWGACESRSLQAAGRPAVEVRYDHDVLYFDLLIRFGTPVLMAPPNG